MTIIRDQRNHKAKREFSIVSVGGAGAETAIELSKVLGNPDDVIVVDREIDNLRPVNIGRRIAIGYPIFGSGNDNVLGDELADANDLFRLKTIIGKSPLVFVMAGLGGNTTLELMPSVIRAASSTGATVLAIVTTPFTFEGRTRSDTASAALERIRKTNCALACIDADLALSNVAIAGDLASELSAAKARVVMNVLSASNASTSGSLNSAPELLDAIKGSGPYLHLVLDRGRLERIPQSSASSDKRSDHNGARFERCRLRLRNRHRSTRDVDQIPQFSNRYHSKRNV